MLDLIGLGFPIFGIALDYIVAAALVAGGLYVFAYFRYIGLALIVAGASVGAAAYGKTLGAADCIAAGRLAETEMKLAAAERDLAAAELTAGLRTRQLAELAEKRAQANEQIAQWQAKAGKLKDAARGCRAATGDDDRRLCAIVGHKAPGCKPVR
jgi:hypothetical protein